MELYFRQGDILFERVDNVNTKDYTSIPDSKTVALGEFTNHHHSFSENSQVLLYSSKQSLEPEILVVNDSKAVLTHQEHLPLQIPRGVYKITREVEYNPFTLQLNKVRD